MTDKERKTLEEAGLLYPAPNCVDYNQKVQVIAKEMADRIWEAINDKVQVVRCKDCKWHNTTEHEKCVAYDAFWVTDPDDYCAWGERREDETD